MALLLALARNVPQAHASLTGGAWERSKLSGVELNEKTLGIMGFGFILFQTMPQVFLSLFVAEGENPETLLAIGVPALRIITVSWLLAAICIVSASVFQALGHGVLSLVVSLVRQLGVLLPTAFLLSRLFGLDMVWWAFPCAEVAGVTMSILYTKRIRKNIISKMTPRDAEGNPIEA
jgi:Na+-driven multidrug efflux pump